MKRDRNGFRVFDDPGPTRRDEWFDCDDCDGSGWCRHCGGRRRVRVSVEEQIRRNQLPMPAHDPRDSW